MTGTVCIPTNPLTSAPISFSVGDSKPANFFSLVSKITKVSNSSVPCVFCEFLSTLYKTDESVAKMYPLVVTVRNIVVGDAAFHAVIKVLPNKVAQLGERYHISCCIKGALFMVTTDFFNHALDKMSEYVQLATSTLLTSPEVSQSLQEKKEEL